MSDWDDWDDWDDQCQQPAAPPPTGPPPTGPPPTRPPEPIAQTSSMPHNFPGAGRGRLLNILKDLSRKCQNHQENPGASNIGGGGRRGEDNFSNVSLTRRRTENRTKKVIYVPSQKVGRIIGRGGIKIRELEHETDTKIKVGESRDNQTEISVTGNIGAILRAEEIIKNISKGYVNLKKQVNVRVPPIEEPCPNFLIINEDGLEVVDWDRLNAFHDKYQKERNSILPAIIKDVYNEDPHIAAMPLSEVAQWRKDCDINVKRICSYDQISQHRNIPTPVRSFEQAFQHYPEILEVLMNEKFPVPSPFQSQAWPILLSGEDMIGISPSGTGKTLGYLLPALIHVDRQPTPREQREGPTVLIIVPTRELALQLNREIKKINYRGIKSVIICGGGERKEPTMDEGIDIVIATPGKLEEFVVARIINVINFTYIVLDEADRMMEMGFEPQIRKSFFDLRPHRQTVMTSATWPSTVQRLVDSFMTNPIQVNVGPLKLAAAQTVTQNFIFLDPEEKDDYIMDFLLNLDDNDKIVVFCGSKATARHIYSELCVKGVEAQLFYGEKHQPQSELEEMLETNCNIVIATDVMSRGIDMKDVTHVVNMDFPRRVNDYVHRIGRTGRAGKPGKATSIFTEKDCHTAADLIKVLKNNEQLVPSELDYMAKKFKAMSLNKRKKKRSDGSGPSKKSN